MSQEKQFTPTKKSLEKISFAVKMYDERFNSMQSPDAVLTDKEKVINLVFGGGAYKYWCSEKALEKAKAKSIKEFDQSQAIAKIIMDRYGDV